MIVLGLVVYLGCAAATLHEPPIGDSTDFLVVADGEAGNPMCAAYLQGISVRGMWHPRAYVEVLIGCTRLFGYGVAGRRAPGIPIFLLTAWLTLRLAVKIRVQEGLHPLFPAFAFLFFCSAPLAIKGSTHLDIDNTLLSLGCMALVSALVAWERRPFLVAMAFGAALWAKLTTPIAVLGGVFLCYVASRRAASAVWLALVAAPLGAALFVATWWAYCRWKGLPAIEPFRYIWGTLLSKGGGTFEALASVGFARTVLRVGLWFSPFLIALAGVGAAIGLRGVRAQGEPSVLSVVAFVALAVFLGYFLIGRVIYGFPKYHVPALPLLCILAARACEGWMRRVERWPTIAVAIAAVALLQVILVGDLLYLTDYALKDARATSEAAFSAAVRDAALHGAVGMLLAGGLLLLGARRAGVTGVLAILLLGSSLGNDWLQFRPGYSTCYGYGIRGTVETVCYLREHVPPERRVMAPREVLYLRHDRVSPCLLDQEWTDVDRMVRVLEDPATGALVMCVGGHTQAQLQIEAGRNRCHEVLSRLYRLQRIGSYLIWIRI